MPPFFRVQVAKIINLGTDGPYLYQKSLIFNLEVLFLNAVRKPILNTFIRVTDGPEELIPREVKWSKREA